MHGEATRGGVQSKLTLIQEASIDATRHPAEQAMLLEQTAEVLADVQEHVDLILASAL